MCDLWYISIRAGRSSKSVIRLANTLNYMRHLLNVQHIHKWNGNNNLKLYIDKNSPRSIPLRFSKQNAS